MKASDRYKAYMEELQAKAKTASSHGARMLRARARKVRDHYNKARNLESRTDEENRIDICNGDQRSISGKYDARSNISNDPVYQMLKKAFYHQDEAFSELRGQKKFKYENNSRKNPQAKRHKGFFQDFVFYEGMRKIETRTMNEETYNQFLENGLMFAYEKSKERMESLDGRRKELKGKYQEGKLTPKEGLEAMYLALCR